MRKFVISASVALGALLASAAPSLAATVTSFTLAPTFTTAGTIDTISFNNDQPGPGLQGAIGAYTMKYYFSIGANLIGTIQEATLSDANGDAGISSFLLRMVSGGSTLDANGADTDDINVAVGTLNSSGGQVRSGYELGTGLVAGTYYLQVQGTGQTGTSAFFNGNFDITLAAVPLPGAVVLMGSVLLGGAGFASWRNRQRRQQIA